MLMPERILSVENEEETRWLRSELSRVNELFLQETELRRKAEQEIVEIAQKAQKWFGSQLHDGLCQSLAGILMFAEMLTQKMENERTVEVAELRRISGMLHEAVNQARETARGLYLEDLAAGSLHQSLQELASRTAGLLGIGCLFHCPEPVRIHDTNTATHLYRIAQEGVMNAVHHGKARSIEISLLEVGEALILSVKDDGIGFAPDSHACPDFHGIGLKIIAYRSRIIGASFQIEPNQPHGAILTCLLKRNHVNEREPA